MKEPLEGSAKHASTASPCSSTTLVFGFITFIVLAMLLPLPLRAQNEEEYNSRPPWVETPILVVEPELPHMLMVLGKQWSVVTVSIIPLCKDGCQGYTDEKHHIIWLRTPQPLHEMQDTLYHEVSHAAFMEQGTSGVQQEQAKRVTIHQMIWKFAAVWSRLFRDNPSLASYLAAQ